MQCPCCHTAGDALRGEPGNNTVALMAQPFLNAASSGNVWTDVELWVVGDRRIRFQERSLVEVGGTFHGADVPSSA